MALLFSAVTVTAGNEEIEFTVGGIPREYDDLVGWTAFDDFMENVDAETELIPEWAKENTQKYLEADDLADEPDEDGGMTLGGM